MVCESLFKISIPISRPSSQLLIVTPPSEFLTFLSDQVVCAPFDIFRAKKIHNLIVTPIRYAAYRMHHITRPRMDNFGQFRSTHQTFFHLVVAMRNHHYLVLSISSNFCRKRQF